MRELQGRKKGPRARLTEARPRQGRFQVLQHRGSPGAEELGEEKKLKNTVLSHGPTRPRSEKKGKRSADVMKKRESKAYREREKCISPSGGQKGPSRENGARRVSKEKMRPWGLLPYRQQKGDRHRRGNGLCSPNQFKQGGESSTGGEKTRSPARKRKGKDGFSRKGKGTGFSIG